MTEVTIDNFDDLFVQITDEIANCSFISIHVELTGRQIDLSNVSLNHSPEISYHRLRQSAVSFLPCQIGLSIFRRRSQSSTPSFKCCVYTFFLCPRFYDPNHARVFSIQTSMAELLNTHGFDFGRMFAQGISFMNEVEEKELRHRLGFAYTSSSSSSSAPASSSTSTSTTYSNKVNPNRLPSPPPFLDYYEQLMSELVQTLTKWEYELNQHQSPSTSSANTRLQFAALPNDLQSYLLIRHLRQQFTNLWIELDALDENVLLVRQVSPEERAELENDTLKFENEIIVAYLMGFSRLFRILMESKKPLVGFEFLLPIFHCVQHFVKPLPDRLCEMLQLVQSSFPAMFDIREMLQFCRSNPLTASSLAFVSHDLSIHALHKRLQSPEIVSHLPKVPEVLCLEQDNSILSAIQNSPSRATKLSISGHHFESGHASYIVGLIFIKLAHWSHPNYHLQNKTVEFDDLLESLAVVQNRLHLNSSGSQMWNLGLHQWENEKQLDQQSAWVCLRNCRSERSVSVQEIKIKLARWNVNEVICIKKITNQIFLIEMSDQAAAENLCRKVQSDSDYIAYRYLNNQFLKLNTSTSWIGWTCSALIVSLIAFTLFQITNRK